MCLQIKNGGIAMEKKPRMELRRVCELRRMMILDRESVIISIENAARNCQTKVVLNGILDEKFDSELRLHGYETYAVRQDGFLKTVISW